MALKLIQKKELDTKLIQKLKMEIRNMKKLRGHPHIAQLIEVIDMPEQICMAIEYCAGGDFFELISNHEKVSQILKLHS